MTDFPHPAMAQLDTGPLSWVMVEIREALARSRTALFEAGGRAAEDQAIQLQHAKSHLHQAHGALQMVDIDGVARLTALAEVVLERFKDGALKCSPDHVEAVARLYQALVEYLEELLEGAPSQPLRLYPYYRDLLRMVGAERVHPADLFFPDLSHQPAMPLAATVPPADYPAWRQRYEKALLAYMKSADPAAQREHAATLRDTVALVADAQHDARARAFWLAMQSFAELVADGQQPGGVPVKQLFGLINQQIRRLSQGESAQPEAMLRDALFFIAAQDAAGAPPLAQRLRRIFMLDGLVPADYETPRYGQVDAAALERAKAAMTQAKGCWDRLASAELDPTLDAAFGRALQQVADECPALNLPALGMLLRQLAEVAAKAVTVGRSEELALEITTALLFAEHGLQQIRHLTGDFAAHADTIAARLQALVSGHVPPAPAQWQGGLARQMQQDDTVVALAMEMKTGLRQVEKVLDDYYVDASKRPHLKELVGVMHQLHGALSILDQDDAMEAAGQVQHAIAALADGTGDPAQEPKALDDIAQNVGALGFFVDMLAQNPAGARERFTFDAEHGTFRAVPFRKMAAAESIPVLDEEMPPPAPPPLPVAEAPPPSSEAAVEAELLEIFIAEAQEVLQFVGTTLALPRTEAGTLDNLTMLRRSFHTLKGSGRMVGLNRFADAAHSIEKVMNVWLAELRPASAPLFELLERAARELGAWVEQLAGGAMPSGGGEALIAAADRLREGGEPEPQATAPAMHEVHGAARADDSMEALEFAAVAEAAGFAEEIEAAELADDTAAREQAAAALVSDAHVEQAHMEQAAEAAAAQAADAAAEAAIQAAAVAETEAHAATAATAAAAEAEAKRASEAASAPRRPSVSGNVIEFPTVAAPQVAPDDNIKHIGGLDIPLPLYNIYLAETDELVRLLARDFGEWRHEPRRPVSPDALHAAHTLTGTSGTVGFSVLRELAHALEMTLQSLQPPAAHLDQVQHDLLDFTIERIRQMLQSFAQGDMPVAQPELITALHDLREVLATTPPAASDAIEARLDTLLAETLDNIAVTAPARAGGGGQSPERAADQEAHEPPLDQLFRDAYDGLSGTIPEADEPPAPKRKKYEAQADDIDDMFNAAFDDTFAEPPLTQMAPPQVGEALSEQVAAPVSPREDDIALASEALAGVAAEAEAAEMAMAAQAESQVALLSAAPPDAPAQEAETVAEQEAEQDAQQEAQSASAVTAVEPALEPEAEPEPEPEAEAEVIALAPAEPQLLAAAPAVFHDELDPDLLPVFLEEGADLLPQVGQSLRAWQHAPADTSHAKNLLRVLHTVKGSARMAGAMRLGQHAHEIETHIENMVHAGSASPHAFEELLAHYDHALLLFEQLQNPAAWQEAAAVAAAVAPAAPGQTSAVTETVAASAAQPGSALEGASATPAAPLAPALPAAPTGVDEETQAAKSPLVRVRADILDRLVNQAGEVSISRSKLENEVGTLRSSLFEFSENLTRLRRQLREVEMQAESQIASRMSISSEREFDPLEFDRFTRLQELTRMMAESVNDVASFHDSLTRSVDNASDDLSQQARQTRDLQRDLMRVRMVPFASISERLFRVARQSAKEVDKRVNLDIRGGTVEIDRSVLERMAAPFEHLLRNAIAHGVEPRAARTAAGKNETGELLVQVTQEGNEVVIAFSDDGAGLDLERIRAKARGNGLLGEDEDVSDAQAMELIFEPGFSTADALTELAGRGVGMDIVRSEAQALGGRVDTVSERGKGARFTIRLPLTLAVTQVVLLGAGGRTYAMPSILVEQVLQMKEAPLAEAYRHGHVTMLGQQAALHYLPELLGEVAARPPVPRSSPVMLLKNGNERLAVQVDEVLGNREVVIKNIGPQLSRMPGIAGATVLGSGEIVLILNPVAMAQHLAHQPAARARQAAPVVGVPMAREKVIMVVDDSMTVRRVTQRLLEREGYLVMLAKDGVDALEQLQGQVPDLMLVDIEMPRMDGFDLTRNVRGDERTHAIPIIMITSRSADKHRNYALQLGVNAYFGKPFQEPVLLDAIAGLLQS
ncbi:hybrid sensor histidine kinase/response regulator [Rugamonas apoptosis]